MESCRAVCCCCCCASRCSVGGLTTEFCLLLFRFRGYYLAADGRYKQRKERVWCAGANRIFRQPVPRLLSPSEALSWPQSARPAVPTRPHAPPTVRKSWIAARRQRRCPWPQRPTPTRTCRCWSLCRCPRSLPRRAHRPTPARPAPPRLRTTCRRSSAPSATRTCSRPFWRASTPTPSAPTARRPVSSTSARSAEWASRTTR